MQITIESTNTELASGEKKHLKQHVKSLFERVRWLIDSVSISVSDANGPKGGCDKHCTVVIRGKFSKAIVVKDKKPATTQAVRQALSRANRALVKQWKRNKLAARQWRRKPSELLIADEASAPAT